VVGVAYAEGRGLFEADELGWSERAEVAIATVSAYLVDVSEGQPETRVTGTHGARVFAILIAAACMVVELAWIGFLMYFVFAYLGLYEALFSPR
jgi:hypothetical protein